MKIIAQQQLSFRDASAFCEAVQGFDVEFHQLDCGNLKANLAFLVSEECGIQHVGFNRRFHQRGSGPVGMLNFGLSDESTLRNWCGALIYESSLLNFSRPSGYDSVSERGFTGYTFSVSERLLQQELNALGSTIRASDIRASGDWRLPDANLRELLRSIGHQSVSDSSAVSWQTSRLTNLESSLANTLAQVITAGETINQRINPRQRNRAIGKSLDLIFARSDPISISDLHIHSGVCWRTLDRAFKERFGMGPKQYIVAVRLAAVRTALQLAPPNQTITEIASEWGFGHLGRFSASYNKMFGELPSQTLRK